MTHTAGQKKPTDAHIGITLASVCGAAPWVVGVDVSARIATVWISVGYPLFAGSDRCILCFLFMFVFLFLFASPFSVSVELFSFLPAKPS